MKTIRLILTWMFFAFSIFYLVNAMALRWGTLFLPGPGVFPVLVSVVLTILTFIMAIRASVSRERGENPFPRGSEGCRVLGVFGSLVFYGITLSFFGHPISSAICFGAILKIMGLKQWNRIIIGGCLAALISWYLFGILLELPLPLLPMLRL